jgi:hypothetical protein
MHQGQERQIQELRAPYRCEAGSLEKFADLLHQIEIPAL